MRRLFEQRPDVQRVSARPLGPHGHRRIVCAGSCGESLHGFCAERAELDNGGRPGERVIEQQ